MTLFIRLFAVLAVAAYVVRVGLDIDRVKSINLAYHDRLTRRIWTAGLVCFWLHFSLAFWGFHGGSHARAYEHTASETERVIGIFWGGGIYVNYLFLTFWTGDVAFWWMRNAGAPYRHPSYLRLVHAVFGFMMVNATVVFGRWYWWPVATVVIAAWVILGRRARGWSNGNRCTPVS